MNLGASAIVLRPRTPGRDPRPRVPSLGLPRARPLRAPRGGDPAARPSPAASRSATRRAGRGPRCGRSPSTAGGDRAGRLHGGRGAAALLRGARRGAGAAPLRAPPRLVPGHALRSAACSSRPPACPSSSACPSRGRASSSSTRRACSRARAPPTPSGAATASSPAAAGLVFGVLLALLLAQAGVRDHRRAARPGPRRRGLPARRALRRALLRTAARPTRSRASCSPSPTSSTARFLDYIDARTRADGWDIQLRFMAIAAREEGRREGRRSPLIRRTVLLAALLRPGRRRARRAGGGDERQRPLRAEGSALPLLSRSRLSAHPRRARVVPAGGHEQRRVPLAPRGVQAAASRAPRGASAAGGASTATRRRSARPTRTRGSGRRRRLSLPDMSGFAQVLFFVLLVAFVVLVARADRQELARAIATRTRAPTPRRRPTRPPAPEGPRRPAAPSRRTWSGSSRAPGPPRRAATTRARSTTPTPPCCAASTATGSSPSTPRGPTATTCAACASGPELQAPVRAIARDVEQRPVRRPRRRRSRCSAR